ncbi:hypothetical protein WAF17_02830 [Bernardetia sp. ABR2-2B]|uniref:hypothetical protein n=1 Tax=Bernardetia sp. ABR2-2B TaxID=3127472 RepID=UPI0030CC20D6
MLEISANNASLDLDNDAKITIKQNNSLFKIIKKENKQSYSYPFTLPTSRINNSIISNTLEEQKKGTLQTILRANGIRLFKADLITKRSNTGYEVNLQLNKKVDLFNRKLNTLFDELGTFFITEDNHFVELNLRSLFFIPTASWDNYTGSITAVVTGITYTVSNTWDNLISDLVNAINADTNSNAVATVNGIDKIKIERFDTNLPFSAYADNTKTTNSTAEPILAFFERPNDNWDNKLKAKTHVDAIDALADFRNSDYCFPFFLVEMETNTIFQFVVVNAFNEDTQEYERYNDGVFLPSFRITALIEKILSLEGWKLESDFLKDIEIEKLFLTNPYAVAEKISNTWHITQNLQFFVADCLPDISFSELITELQNLFCLNVNYDHTRKILKIETANSIISKKLAKEYACTERFSEIEKEKTEGYLLKYNLEDNPDRKEKLNTGFLTSKTIENGTQEIISNFPFLPLYQVTPDVFAFPFLEKGLRMPSSFAKFGYVQGFELLLKELWIKEGVVKSFNFISYIDKRAKFQTDNYSLLWESLYQKFWKNYLNLIDNSEVEREIIFTFSELQGIDLTELIRLEYSNYFIKDIEYTLTNKEQLRILAKVNLIKTL